MIPVETQYKTHGAELLAIVKALKTWHYYLKGCKHKVLVLTDHTNLREEFGLLSGRGKANKAADAFFCFSQRSVNEKEKVQAKNTQIFQRLQSLLTNASFSGLSISAKLLPLYQVLICRTYVFPRLRQFWTDIQTELAKKNPYKTSISGMRLRLAELQESAKEAQKIRTTGELQDGYKEVNGVLHHHGLLFVPEII